MLRYSSCLAILALLILLDVTSVSAKWSSKNVINYGHLESLDLNVKFKAQPSTGRLTESAVCAHIQIVLTHHFGRSRFSRFECSSQENPDGKHEGTFTFNGFDIQDIYLNSDFFSHLFTNLFRHQPQENLFTEFHAETRGNIAPQVVIQATMLNDSSELFTHDPMQDLGKIYQALEEEGVNSGRELWISGFGKEGNRYTAMVAIAVDQAIVQKYDLMTLLPKVLKSCSVINQDNHFAVLMYPEPVKVTLQVKTCIPYTHEPWGQCYDVFSSSNYANVNKTLAAYLDQDVWNTRMNRYQVPYFFNDDNYVSALVEVFWNTYGLGDEPTNAEYVRKAFEQSIAQLKPIEECKMAFKVLGVLPPKSQAPQAIRQH